MHILKSSKGRTTLFIVYFSCFLYALFHVMVNRQTELSVFSLYALVVIISLITLGHRCAISRFRGIAMLLVGFISLTVLYVFPGLILSVKNLPESRFIAQVSYCISLVLRHAPGVF